MCLVKLTSDPLQFRGETLSNSDLIREVHNSFARSNPQDLRTVVDRIMFSLSRFPALTVQSVIKYPAEFVDYYIMPSSKKVVTSLMMSIGLTIGQSCQPATLANSVPSDGSNLALQSYSYCSGILNVTSYIKVRAIK